MAPPVRDVSVADFAADWGVSTQRVYQWIGEGMPHRKRGEKPTRIVRHEANAWRLEQAAKAAKPRSDTPRARERRELAEAELKEILVLERRRALVPVEEVEGFVDSFIGGFAAVASGRLQRFERDIVSAATPGAARVITEQIHEQLMAGAQEYRAQIEVEASALEHGDASTSGTENAA